MAVPVTFESVRVTGVPRFVSKCDRLGREVNYTPKSRDVIYG